MRYMQIIKATDIDEARRSYLDLLNRRGVALTASTEVYVETVHRPGTSRDAWLCYCAQPTKRAA